MTRTAFLLAALLVAVTPGGLPAQETDTLDVRAVLAKLRATGSATAAAAFLAQEGRRRSGRELDELADSLVAIATSYRRGDPLDLQRAAGEARGALLAAAHSGHLAERAQTLAERGLEPPIAYPRAFEKLVDVFEGAQEVGIRAGTLWSLTQLPDAARAGEFLGDVAKSTDGSAARAAILYLSIDMGEAGFTVLRRLYETNAVVNLSAREDLDAIANVRGWKR